MGYGILADVLVAIHVAYVSYVVLGQLAIWLGLMLRWAWVRNPWFRWSHLLMIAIVGGEAVLGIECPLTRWERELRLLAGQATSGESFMGRLMHKLIFVSWPEWVINSLHVGFALSKIDEREAAAAMEFLEGIGQAYEDEISALRESLID